MMRDESDGVFLFLIFFDEVFYSERNLLPVLMFSAHASPRTNRNEGAVTLYRRILG
jgi:hypothetical protein